MEITEIFWNNELRSQNYTKIFIYAFLLNQIAYTFPIIYYILIFCFGNTDISTWQLPFEIELPFDINSLRTFLLAWFIEFNMALSYFVAMSSATTYFASACIFIDSMCDYFVYIIESVGNDAKAMRMEENPQKNAKLHQQVTLKILKSIEVHIQTLE